MPKAGSTSVSTIITLRDSSTGALKTGLTHNSAGASASYARPGAARQAITLATQTVDGAYSSGGFCEIDATNMPGKYRFDVPDAALASGAAEVEIVVAFTGSVCDPINLPLTAYDGQVGSNLGLSALPTANPGAEGGLGLTGEATDALATYDPPTKAELDAAVADIARSPYIATSSIAGGQSPAPFKTGAADFFNANGDATDYLYRVIEWTSGLNAGYQQFVISVAYVPEDNDSPCYAVPVTPNALAPGDTFVVRGTGGGWGVNTDGGMRLSATEYLHRMIEQPDPDIAVWQFKATALATAPTSSGASAQDVADALTAYGAAKPSDLDRLALEATAQAILTALSALGAGSGAAAITLTVKNGSGVAMAGVPVALQATGGVNVQTSDSSGHVVFNRDDGSYTYAIADTGAYAGATGTVTVASGAVTAPTGGILTVTAITIPAPSAGSYTLYNTEEDENGVVFGAGAMTVKVVSITPASARADAANNLVNSVLGTDVQTNAAGLWSMSIPQSLFTAEATLTIERSWSQHDGTPVVERMRAKLVAPTSGTSVAWADLSPTIAG